MKAAFSARVELYAGWDLKLQSRTRFFGAAALVNAALAELWPGCALAHITYGRGLRFLAGLGTYLQACNAQMLRRIELGHWRAADWDAALVRSEQLAVETFLERLESSERANVIRQVDRFLYLLARRIGSSRYGPCTAMLSGGLQQIQLALPRELRFSLLSDRVAVGTTLIRMVRAAPVRHT